MTKNEYLNLRKINDKATIMHEYHNENVGLAKLEKGEFLNSLNTFIRNNATESNSAENIFDSMFDDAVDYFDKKFSITYIEVTRKRVVTEKIIIIRP